MKLESLPYLGRYTLPPPSTTCWFLYHMYQLYQVSAGSVGLKFYFNHQNNFFFFVMFLKPTHTNTYAFFIHCLAKIRLYEIHVFLQVPPPTLKKKKHEYIQHKFESVCYNNFFFPRV